MSLEEFLAALAQTPRDWRLNHGQIRRRDEEPMSVECPVIAVGAMFRKRPDHGTQRAIFRASDNYPSHDPALRRQLLDACGLSEARA